MKTETFDVAASYDKMAETYDEAFNDPESVKENEFVFNIVGDCKGKDVLDIGCGTGLALEYIKPEIYLGIDPSRGMLARLLRKFSVAVNVECQRFEDYLHDDNDDLTFDVILCLFGSAAYIDSDALMRIPALLRPFGRYVVMFMDDDYVPVAYERTGSGVVPYKAGIHADLPGKRYHIGHYTIIEGSNG